MPGSSAGHDVQPSGGDRKRGPIVGVLTNRSEKNCWMKSSPRPEDSPSDDAVQTAMRNVSDRWPARRHERSSTRAVAGAPKADWTELRWSPVVFSSIGIAERPAAAVLLVVGLWRRRETRADRAGLSFRTCPGCCGAPRFFTCTGGHQ